MAQAKQGDTVKVNYSGVLKDGTEFDSSVGRDPLQFIIGDGMLIPAFEEAVVGMNPGDSKTIDVPAEEAYGPYIDDLVIELDRNQVPPSIEPEVGMQLQITQDDGSATVVKVLKATDAKVYLDANHPLAGKDLTFSVQLVEILN